MPSFILDPATWVLAIQEDPEFSSRIRAEIVGHLSRGRDLAFTMRAIHDLRDLAGLPTDQTDRVGPGAWADIRLDDAGLGRLEDMLSFIHRLISLAPMCILDAVHERGRFVECLDKITSDGSTRSAVAGATPCSSHRREFLEKLASPVSDGPNGAWDHLFRTEFEILCAASSEGVEVLTASSDTKLLSLHANLPVNAILAASPDSSPSTSWSDLVNALRAYADQLPPPQSFEESDGWFEETPREGSQNGGDDRPARPVR